uniref:DUF5648 domain-containing protein n=1 Tax=viral metagenome TaxID=1070528 RepID=A0A6C0CR38_9ZZZZ
MYLFKQITLIGLLCVIRSTTQQLITFHSSVGNSYNACLDVTGGLSTPFATFHMFECNNSPAQQFFLQFSPSSSEQQKKYKIHTVASNGIFCIRALVSGMAKYNIDQYTCESDWDVHLNTDGTVTLKLMNSEPLAPEYVYCLDMQKLYEDNTLVMVSAILIAPCDGSPSQKFIQGSYTPFYRLYNPSNGNHLWTPLKTERTESGYVFEGMIGHIWMDSCADHVPLYRFIETNDQMFLTTNKDEGLHVGFTYVEIIGYVRTTPYLDYNAMHRFYNGKIHFYSTNPNEGTLAGYAYEGIVFYIGK